MTQLTAGHPEPLGARFDGKGVNFTLFRSRGAGGTCVFDGKVTSTVTIYRPAQGISGTGTCPVGVRGCITVFAYTVRGNRLRALV